MYQSTNFRITRRGTKKSHLFANLVSSERTATVCYKATQRFTHRNSHSHAIVVIKRFATRIRWYCMKEFTQGGKPYKCNTCNNTFSQSTHLLTHKRSVHSALTEECKVCKKKFQSSEYARKHEVSMHSNTKDFQCEKCMKMFKLSSHLKAHKAVHEKKSVCLQHVSKDLFIKGYFAETY